MDTRDLTLDNFLSRFQLLRPQVNSTSLNQRQAAVLIPVVRREVDGQIYCSAGGGLVADSQAAAEYQETFDKVNRILQQLES